MTAAWLSIAIDAMASGTGKPEPLIGPFAKSWIRSQIRAYESTDPKMPSAVVRKVQHEGRPAYLIMSPCCDQFNYLYRADGAIVCAPSGGFVGSGDGRCPGVLPVSGSASAPRTQ